MSKIGVFPAAGGLGGSVTAHLAKLVPASQLVLITRKPANQAALRAAGADVRYADYDFPETLEHAFDGVDVLMLVSYPSTEVEYRFESHKKAISAALSSSVSHIFYSSLAFGGACAPSSVASVMQPHLLTEQYLAELASSSPDAKLTYTAIREGLYHESFPVYTGLFDLARPGAEITIPHDGRGPGVAWAKRDELGEATAKMVLSFANAGAEARKGFEYLNKVVLLSGPREVSLAETARILGEVAGIEGGVPVRQIGVDEYVGLPQIRGFYVYRGRDWAREWTSAWEGIRRGETAVVNGVLERWLGREPEEFEETVRALKRSQT